MSDILCKKTFCCKENFAKNKLASKRHHLSFKTFFDSPQNKMDTIQFVNVFIDFNQYKYELSVKYVCSDYVYIS